MRNESKWLIIAQLSTVILMFLSGPIVAWGMLAGWINLGTFYSTALPLIGCLWIVIVSLLLLHSWREHIRTRKLIKHHFKICQSCAYILEGHEQSGKCPECGEKFDTGSVKQLWLDNKIFPWRVEKFWAFRVKRTLLERLGILLLSLCLMLLVILICAIGFNKVFGGSFASGIVNVPALLGLTFVSGIAVTFVLYNTSRRTRTMVTQNKGNVCPGCLSILRDDSGQLICPECQIPFSKDALDVAWSNGYCRLPWRLVRVKDYRQESSLIMIAAWLFFLAWSITLVVSIMYISPYNQAGQLMSWQQILMKPLVLFLIIFGLIATIFLRLASNYDKTQKTKADTGSEGGE